MSEENRNAVREESDTAIPEKDIADDVTRINTAGENKEEAMLQEEKVIIPKERKEVQKKMPKKERGRGGGLMAGLLALLLFGGGGYALGNGLIGTGGGNQTPTSAEVDTGGKEEVSDTVIIRIEETTVTVNGHECKDEEELRAYLEKIYSDDKIFILEEKNAILGTYEWVDKTCSDMGISLKK